ncbi:MAG: hypothetical protein GXY80_02920 [Syntrophorhabdus aromaticivorans]|uniref:Uncharacterized protein n=1 Tax=Syntrophorhabdus aromaticivorans TaxID=328301 RepID=A0A351U6C1_9BACT|nr:hypothetical protein [Syntrophorhabdus aromaticivorans]HBA55502.1 hypothetical protein [Syntrophorhabdus aromaticivorans]
MAIILLYLHVKCPDTEDADAGRVLAFLNDDQRIAVNNADKFDDIAVLDLSFGPPPFQKLLVHPRSVKCSEAKKHNNCPPE